MSKYNQTSRNRPVLNQEQKEQIVSWLADGYSPAGIQTKIKQYNQEAADQNLPLFPTLHYNSIQYYAKKFEKEVNTAYEVNHFKSQNARDRGLRNKETRIDRLESAADQLMPYLAQANSRGEFTASIQYCNILNQIRAEVELDPRQMNLDPQSLRGLSSDQLAALYKKNMGL